MPTARRHDAWIRKFAAAAVALGAATVAAPGLAATCVWNVAIGSFTVAGNWTGCADLPGPSTRSPGATDIALIANGTAQLGSSQSVAELELGMGGLLSVVGGSLPVFTVSGALRLNGGGTTTVLGTNQLRLALPAGATGTLLAPSTLDNASFLENSGSLNLGSASGVTLTLSNAARIDNLAGGVVNFAGANSRLDMYPGTEFRNHVGGTVTVNGTLQAGPPAPQTSPAVFRNDGSMSVTGPGTLTLRGSGNGGTTRFDQNGSLTVSNATVVCRSAANECVWSDANGGPVTGAITTLDGGTMDCGGPSGPPHSVSVGSTVRGAGSLDCRLDVRGTLAPGVAGGAPYGTLSVSGGINVGPGGVFDFDLGGNSAGSYDRVVSGGTCGVGSSSFPDGLGKLMLRLAPGYAPPLGEALPVFTYADIQDMPAFNRVDANGALDYATRFDPTQMVVFPAPRLDFEDASLVEGNSGSAILSFTLRLSQPSALTVTARVRTTPGTAASGLPPSGDYTAGVQDISFAPGQVTRTATATIYGDTVVEGDQSFILDVARHAMQNAAFGNGRPGRLAAVGTILTDDLAPGTRYVLVASGSGPAGVRRYTSAGLFLDTFATGLTGGFNPNTGICFAPDGKVLATRFGQDFAGARLFSRFGAVLVGDFGAAPGMYFNSHESCVYDAAGNVYIGQAGYNDLQTDAQVPVLKFDRNGALLDTFVVPTGDRGTDWIELSSNQCTLYYTSEDATVRRYDLCARTPLPTFTSALTAPCYALRLRPNSELMVACRDNVYRLSPQGNIVDTYSRQSIGETDAQGLFALNLDPDGTSFWTAGALSGMVYRVDIASGDVLTAFASGASGGASGLAVYDELSETDVLLADGFESGTVAPKSALAPRDPDNAPTGPSLPHYSPLGLMPPPGND